ncbi:TPA: hypothetical protein ACOYWD_002204, partial [Streptococcus pneumoniae]
TMIDSFNKYTGMDFLLPKKLIHYQEVFNSDNVKMLICLTICVVAFIVLVWLIDVVRGVKNGN